MRRIESIDAKSEPQKGAETYNAVDVTKEQITEVLQRLRSFGYWTFTSKYSCDRLDKVGVKWQDRSIKISISDNGLYQLSLDNGQICYYDAQAALSPAPKGSLHNTKFMVRITNSEDLLPDDLEFCKSYIPNIMWLFRQVLIFGTFDAFDQTILNSYVRNLESMVAYQK
jgi:hypothetical protein